MNIEYLWQLTSVLIQRLSPFCLIIPLRGLVWLFWVNKLLWSHLVFVVSVSLWLDGLPVLQPDLLHGWDVAGLSDWRTRIWQVNTPQPNPTHLRRSCWGITSPPAGMESAHWCWCVCAFTTFAPSCLPWPLSHSSTSLFAVWPVSAAVASTSAPSVWVTTHFTNLFF